MHTQRPRRLICRCFCGWTTGWSLLIFFSSGASSNWSKSGRPSLFTWPHVLLSIAGTRLPIRAVLGFWRGLCRYGPSQDHLSPAVTLVYMLAQKSLTHSLQPRYRSFEKRRETHRRSPFRRIGRPRATCGGSHIDAFGEPVKSSFAPGHPSRRLSTLKARRKTPL